MLLYNGFNALIAAESTNSLTNVVYNVIIILSLEESPAANKMERPLNWTEAEAFGSFLFL